MTLTEPQVTVIDKSAPLIEVVVEFEGHTYTVYAPSKEEGEKTVHAHIDAVKNPAPPAE